MKISCLPSLLARGACLSSYQSANLACLRTEHASVRIQSIRCIVNVLNRTALSHMKTKGEGILVVSVVGDAEKHTIRALNTKFNLPSESYLANSSVDRFTS